MTDKQPRAPALADANANLIQRLRRTPMPLADVIPHLQAMGDELRRLHVENEKFKEENKSLTELAVWRIAMIDALDDERKALQAMLNQERTASEARIAALEQAGRMALEALEGGLWDYGPGQDEHMRCDEVTAHLRQALGEDA